MLYTATTITYNPVPTADAGAIGVRAVRSVPRSNSQQHGDTTVRQPLLKLAVVSCRVA
jgi:hypothetical protein